MDLLSTSLGLFGGLLARTAFDHLTRGRSTPAGLADLLGWAFMIDDGLLLQKDGSVLASWRYRGPDRASSTLGQLRNLSEAANRALLPYTDEWVFHVDAVRSPAPGYAPTGAFPDPATALIDEERRAAYLEDGCVFETSHVLTATWLPPEETYARLRDHFIEGLPDSESDWSRHLATFANHLTTLEDRLANHLRLERLDSTELLTHLHCCLTGLRHEVSCPENPSYLNYLLSSKDLVGGWRPRVGEQHVRVVTAHGFPSTTEAADSDWIHTLPYSSRFSYRWIPLGAVAAGRVLRRHRQQWFARRKGVVTRLQEASAQKKGTTVQQRDLDLFEDGSAYAMAQDAAAAIDQVTEGELRFGYYTATCVLHDPDAKEADSLARDVVKQLHNRGISAHLETVNSVEAFLGSLPGQGWPNLRRPLLSSRNLGDLLPLTSLWPGRATNPSPLFREQSPPLLWTQTDGNTPYRLNLHEGDVGHTLILGQTGSGKSVLVSLLVAQWLRYHDAQAFVFDVGYSSRLLAMAAGASHYAIAAESSPDLTFQPLARIHEPAERTWANEWLLTIFTLAGLDLTPERTRNLSEALNLLAALEPGRRTLLELLPLLNDPKHQMQDALAAYTKAGAYGNLLDSNSDSLADGAFQVFELEHLMGMGERIVIPALTYLFHRIEQRLDTGRPTLLVLEEAWLPLMHPKFARQIETWLRTARKKNCAIVLVTQSPHDLLKSEHRSMLLTNCPTRILLPDSDADTETNRPLYRELGLNDRQVELLRTASPKRDYYFTSPSGSRLFELGLGEVALALLTPGQGSSIADTVRQAESFQRQYGPRWLVHWLEHRKVSEGWVTKLDALLRSADAEEAGRRLTPSLPQILPAPSEVAHA